MERVSYCLVTLLLSQYAQGQMSGAGHYFVSTLNGKITEHSQASEASVFGSSYIKTLIKCLSEYLRHKNVYDLVGAEICKISSPSGYQCRLLMNYGKRGYVVTDPSNQDCQFLEIEEKDVSNVAAKRHSNMSSVLLGLSNFGPSNAVDGITICPVSSWYLAMTQLENYPWFQVDFGSPVDVLKVLIIGRQDCCYERLSEVFVSVYHGANYHLCGHYGGPATHRSHILIYCYNILATPLVMITLNGNGQQNLELCEVAVFGR